MTIEEVKEHFVTWANLMRKLGYSRHAYQRWIRNKEIPLTVQITIEHMTNGMLKASPELRDKYERRKQGRD